MTKDSAFAVPKPRSVNLNALVNDVIKPIPKVHWKDKVTAVKKIDTSEVWKRKTLTSNINGINWNFLNLYEQQKYLRKKAKHQCTMRYIKNKLREKGIDNANIFLSYETLEKISERLLRSESMGSDQNVVNKISNSA